MKWINLSISCISLLATLESNGQVVKKADSATLWPKGVKALDNLPAYNNPDEAISIEPLKKVNESNIKYRKRIWRCIDTRQKLNGYFYWPGQPLNQVVYELAVSGKIAAYPNDSLARPYKMGELKNVGDQMVAEQLPWGNQGDVGQLKDTIYLKKFNWKEIVKFEIMEDWIFDVQAGEMAPRIIAIAPITAKMLNGISTDLPMFWLKMEDLRPDFVKRVVQTRDGQLLKLNWDEVFNKYRLFDSYIVKQSSSDNTTISGRPEWMQNGLGALLEADKIKQELFIFGHDLWEY